jgi:hypothetical protein
MTTPAHPALSAPSARSALHALDTPRRHGPRWRGALFGALAALGTLLLSACGGGGGAATEPPPPVAANPERLALASSGELARHVQGVLRARSAGAGGATTFGDAGAAATVSPALTSTGMPTAAAPSLRSDTLLQEAGVDEADLLKSDGTHLYTLATQSQPLRLKGHRRASDGSLADAGTLELAADGADHVQGRGLLLADGSAGGAVLSQRFTRIASPCVGDCVVVGLTPVPGVWGALSVGVQQVGFSAGTPSAGTRLEIDGSLVDSRRVGNRLVLVTLHRPTFGADLLPAGASAADREAAIARVTAADVLPRLRVNGGDWQALVSETQCWLQTANASSSVEVTAITVVDLSSSTLARTSRCFVGGSEALYMTPSALYVATTRWQAQQLLPAVWRFADNVQTDIHKFALGATLADAVSYRGSASVDGHLGWDSQRKSLRLSEHEGLLRVLSFTGTGGWATLADSTSGAAPSPATLTVLRERAGGGALEIVSTLPNARRPAHLGKPGEQVHGVRFIGNRGYLVTFRQIDPLYVLDLADPADPRIAGELELPGFSDHLVPVGEGLLFGVGRDVPPSGGRPGGVKVSLLDVSNPAAPREIANQVFGSAFSQSGLDMTRHGLNLLTDGNRVRIAMPLLLFADPMNGWTQGLQRFEVDTATRTLSAGAMAGASSAGTYPDLGSQRSVQIDSNLYYLRDGAIEVFTW